MDNAPLTRREFVKSTGRRALGLGSGLLILSRDAGAVPPSDRVVVGHVGVGGMGNGHVRAFARERDVEVAAICDVDETRRNATLQRLRQIRPNAKAKAYADFWCHIVDLVFWALSPGSPTTIAARGESPTDGIADAPAWIDVDFEFPDLDLFWTSRRPKLPGTVGRSIGVQFVGTKGSLISEYGAREILLGDTTMRDVPEVPRTLPRSRGHRRNFLDCVKSRRPPDSHINYAHVMTTPMHLACISFRLRRALCWDAEREQFVGDGVADRMLHQPYRAPWRLPA